MQIARPGAGFETTGTNTEIAAEIIDKLAEPINATSFQLIRLQDMQHGRGPVRSPFEQLNPRQQNRSLLAGVDSKRCSEQAQRRGRH